jgi:sulfate transport system substrate-binding protein
MTVSIHQSNQPQNRRTRNFRYVALLALTVASAAHAGTALLNVSYDVTREFYKDYNPLFAEHWKAQTGEVVEVKQSHGGSSKQARSVADGLEADVVTFNQATDLDFLAERGLVAKDWEKKLPDGASPVTSTIVFLVRKGNPKGIRDWDDLVKPGVSVIIPNPKTSGNGRYSYLAAWGYALRREGAGEAVAKEFVTKLFKNVPVLDTGGRGATTTFAQRGLGDVLLTFENEAFLTQREIGADKTEIVLPSVSILAETPVAVVEKVADKHGARKVAEGYLQYLYSPAAQELAAKHFLRPRLAEVLARHGDTFKPIRTLTIAEVAGSWAQAQKTHFADGGVFDQIYLH